MMYISQQYYKRVLFDLRFIIRINKTQQQYYSQRARVRWREFWARPTHWVIISNLLGERIRDEYCVHLNVAISWFFLVNVFAILVNTWGAYPHAGKAKKARMQNRPFFVLLSPVYSILPLGRGRKYWLRWSNYRPWHFFSPSIIIHILSFIHLKQKVYGCSQQM